MQYALEWYADHPALGEPPPTVINWEMGTKVGVWGGSCMCPDGRVYQVGDEGNICKCKQQALGPGARPVQRLLNPLTAVLESLCGSTCVRRRRAGPVPRGRGR
eukprot:7380920-Prymnesium_polylepis.2